MFFWKETLEGMFFAKVLALPYFHEYDYYISNDLDWKNWWRNRLPPRLGLLGWCITKKCLSIANVLKKRMVKVNLFYIYFRNVLWY